MVKLFFLTTILIALSIASHAQDKKIAFSATTGLVISHTELGTEYQEFDFGGHIGFNLYSKKEKRFKTDLQSSLNVSGAQNSSSSFLSVNALYGGRYYIIDPEKPVTAFVNALVGGVYIYELGDDFIDDRFGVGYSVGGFVDINRLMIGAAAESFHNFIFKVGYTF